VWDGAVTDAPAEPLKALVAEAVGRRADVAALDARLEAADLRRRAVRAELYPTVDLTASWSRDSGSAFASQGRGAATIGVTWTPFAAGTRAPGQKIDEYKAQLKAALVDMRGKDYAATNFTVGDLRIQFRLAVLEREIGDAVGGRSSGGAGL